MFCLGLPGVARLPPNPNPSISGIIRISQFSSHWALFTCFLRELDSEPIRSPGHHLLHPSHPNNIHHSLPGRLHGVSIPHHLRILIHQMEMAESMGKRPKLRLTSWSCRWWDAPDWLSPCRPHSHHPLFSLGGP